MSRVSLPSSLSCNASPKTPCCPVCPPCYARLGPAPLARLCFRCSSALTCFVSEPYCPDFTFSSAFCYMSADIPWHLHSLNPRPSSSLPPRQSPSASRSLRYLSRNIWSPRYRASRTIAVSTPRIDSPKSHCYTGLLHLYTSASYIPHTTRHSAPYIIIYTIFTCRPAISFLVRKKTPRRANLTLPSQPLWL